VRIAGYLRVRVLAESGSEGLGSAPGAKPRIGVGDAGRACDLSKLPVPEP